MGRGIRNEEYRKIIENWCKASHYDRPVGYDIDYSDCVVTIYAERPGVLIGYQGKHVFKFKDILKEKFHKEYQVKFVEIRGRIVNLNNKSR